MRVRWFSRCILIVNSQQLLFAVQFGIEVDVGFAQPLLRATLRFRELMGVSPMALTLSRNALACGLAG